MQGIVDNLPNITGEEENVKSLSKSRDKCYANVSNILIDKVQSAFGIALHMHQPTIPAGGGGDLAAAGLISNLQHMMENQSIGDNHNAPVFLSCYTRMSDIVRELVHEGKNPRVMLDYSGNLLWGLGQIDGGKALESLKKITCDPNYYRYVEWTGTMWSHAVVTSTPIPDIILHMKAWRHHFASIFGDEALSRVKGFSPPEMHLPIHPDVCYEYLKALKACGYTWIMVQEHTIENLDGSSINDPHFPHRLVAKNSKGEVEEITALVKTQGSDTKLVAQMQPYYEAKTIGRKDVGGKSIPPFVLQIGDGENGGVMMNEFPPAYKIAFNEIGTEGVVAMNGSEYLEFLESLGVDQNAFTKVQPISQKRVWDEIGGKYAPDAANKAIESIKSKDPNFNLDKGSWTSDLNWVKGYESVLDPMNRLSAQFHEKYDPKSSDKTDPKYREALLYMLLSQTSCFRYWGEGIWTDYAKELSRRGQAILS